jgi:hypothetical protein
MFYVKSFRPFICEALEIEHKFKLKSLRFKSINEIASEIKIRMLKKLYKNLILKMVHAFLFVIVERILYWNFFNKFFRPH